MLRIRQNRFHETEVTIDNARIIWPNFSGAAKKFNAKGDRNCCIVLNEEDAATLKAEGFNVKVKDAKEEGEPPMLYLTLKCKFRNREGNMLTRPSMMYMIVGKKEPVRLDEDTVGQIDFAEIENVDVKFRTAPYDFNGKQGVTAQIMAMYVTIVPDYLAEKYADPSDEEELPFGE